MEKMHQAAFISFMALLSEYLLVLDCWLDKTQGETGVGIFQNFYKTSIHSTSAHLPKENIKHHKLS